MVKYRPSGVPYTAGLRAEDIMDPEATKVNGSIPGHSLSPRPSPITSTCHPEDEETREVVEEDSASEPTRTLIPGVNGPLFMRTAASSVAQIHPHLLTSSVATASSRRVRGFFILDDAHPCRRRVKSYRTELLLATNLLEAVKTPANSRHFPISRSGLKEPRANISAPPRKRDKINLQLITRSQQASENYSSPLSPRSMDLYSLIECIAVFQNSYPIEDKLSPGAGSAHNIWNLEDLAGDD
ncbi:unnamed protein product [Nezara viridula]|uniref:Uncharacterized protein n=1 Tax=Nezara viridula TaxID=85310 RepID=A0A9P0MW23_NEZVI|nr:unnamed protein product [Nezara viridula]